MTTFVPPMNKSSQNDWWNRPILGKNALTSYAEHLGHVSEHKLGLQLLARFKMYQLGDYSILRIVSEMIQSLNKCDLLNFKGIVGMVQRYYHVFEQLRKIIGVSNL